MRIVMLFLWLVTMVPMVALIAWISPALRERWRLSGGVLRAALILAWISSGAIIFFPHEDVFSGLDDAAYRKMAYVFLDGRGFHDKDRVLEKVPAELRRTFYYQPGPLGRPNRDRVFQLSNWESVETTPFFLPMMPLASGGLSPILSPDRFAPMMGTLWLVLVFSVGFCVGGGWGLLGAFALVLATAWPAWFLRGFYPEGVGATMIAGVVLVAAVRPLRGRMTMLAGFILGLVVSYHPTLLLLSVPVWLGLMMEQRKWASTAKLTVGLVVGLFPFWALTRWVCHPYGDWTHGALLRGLLFATPEHRAVTVSLLALAPLGLLLVSLSHLTAWERRLEQKWFCRSISAGMAFTCVVALAMPLIVKGHLLMGWLSVWTGLRWSCALLVLIASISLFALHRPIRERFWVASLFVVALFFLYLKSLEIPVGLWSQRRFLPVVLVGVAFLLVPLSVGLSRCAARGRGVGWGLALLMAMLGLWNLFHWPAAYFTINDRGATEWTRAVADRMGTNRWVVFDYYPHSVPYAAGLKQNVLGVGEASVKSWPLVAKWLSESASTQEVWLATSWAPCTLEDGVKLEPIISVTGHFSAVRTQGFFPSERDMREVWNTFSRVVPIASGENMSQEKVLDDSPVGLRGEWLRARDSGGGRMARWFRQGAGIIGPVPPPGGEVELEVECIFTGPGGVWTQQQVSVLSPWASASSFVSVGEQWETHRMVLHRPFDDAPRPGTGIYTFHVATPFDPGEYGLHGYPDALGVQVRRVVLRALAANESR